ncbi:MAG: hypothetical protein JXA93_15485 [Anaerolineae bacterium]|nr:hypothetical protein [Anaerolineae bacterium]
MSLRTLIRLVALALGLVLASPFVSNTASVVLLPAGLVLLALTFGYLRLLAGGGDLTRWQLRYQLDAGMDLERLDETLSFLVKKAGHLVVEANAEGLSLELPPAFDEYLQAQLPRALCELRLTKTEQIVGSQIVGSSFFFVGAPTSDLLRWATEEESRTVRLHMHRGPYVTATAQAHAGRPPSRCLRIPVPRLLRQVWYTMPVWDELSADTRLSRLFPPTEPGAVYCSRSRLLDLTPPPGFQPADNARRLGTSTDNRPITLGYDLALFTVGAPHSFLSQQVLGDLRHSQAVIVVSPHRSFLERIAAQAEGAPVHWLDPQNPWRSAHLSILAAEEWADAGADAIVDAILTFLADLGVDVHLPGIKEFARRLIGILVSTARQRRRDLTFTDLYSVARSTQALRAWLGNLPQSDPRAGELLSHLDTDAGYVQAVTVLSAIRAALQPLRNGSLRTFCQAPFLDLRQALSGPSLILVPMTDDDFPEHDRLLSAVLDLSLNRVLARTENLRITLHLHEPDLYRKDGSRRWIDIARQDPRVTLLVDRKASVAGTRIEPDINAAQAIFRCSDGQASHLVSAWHLPASASDLDELPADTAIARLPGMVVAVKVRDR